MAFENGPGGFLVLVFKVKPTGFLTCKIDGRVRPSLCCFGMGGHASL